MSNGLAIAAVTSTLRYVLDRALQRAHPGPVGGAAVTTLRPEQLAGTDLAAAAGINVFCYRVTPNHAGNVRDLPTRRANGSLVQPPVAALDVHYLITCYGDETALDAQRLLGRAVTALAVTPVLGRDVVTEALRLYAAETETAFLADSDLADQVELVKLTPGVLSVEELSQLWAAFNTPYLLSLTYLATVVLVEADVAARTSLPVRQRTLTVTPGGPPRLDSVDTDPPGEPVLPGATLVLRGSRLLDPTTPDPTTQVRVGPAVLAPEPGGTAAELRAVLTDAVPGGMHAVQVTQPKAASNTLPLLLRPDVSVTDAAADPITLSVRPPLAAGQRATVLLSRLSGGSPDDPADVSVTFPPVPDDTAPKDTLAVPRAEVPDGTWLVRLRVDGVDSLPTLEGETYSAPALTVP